MESVSLSWCAKSISCTDAFIIASSNQEGQSNEGKWQGQRSRKGEAFKNRKVGGYISLSWTWPLFPHLDADSSMKTVHTAERLKSIITNLLVAWKSCWLAETQKWYVLVFFKKNCRCCLYIYLLGRMWNQRVSHLFSPALEFWELWFSTVEQKKACVLWGVETKRNI